MSWLFRCVVKRIYSNRRKTSFLTKLIGLQCYVRDLATVQKERVDLIRSIWVGVIGSVGSALDLSGGRSCRRWGASSFCVVSCSVGVAATYGSLYGLQIGQTTDYRTERTARTMDRVDL